MRYRHKQQQKDLISKKEAFDLLKEFKKFIFKGNIIDLSVGIIIGGSFNKIISSLVDNVLMPIASLLVPFESSYKSWSLKIYGKEINFGIFIGDLITFVIVSLFLFVIIKKTLYWLFKEEKKVEEMNLEQKTLIEIRDILEEINQRP